MLRCGQPRGVPGVVGVRSPDKSDEEVDVDDALLPTELPPALAVAALLPELLLMLPAAPPPKLLAVAVAISGPRLTPATPVIGDACMLLSCARKDGVGEKGEFGDVAN